VPARSRSRISAHTSAESVGASSVSRSRTGSRPAGPAIVSGQPRTTPLWLNSHGPSANGAAAVATTGMPTVADRTAASAAPATVDAARAGSDASVQIGWPPRWRTGGPPPGGYHATPNPSALIVPPPRMSRGAQAWRARACGGSNSSRVSGTGVPR
jgi:hypothetical protein